MILPSSFSLHCPPYRREMPVMARATLHCDGASKGNPGRASIGAIITWEDGSVAAQLSEAIGLATNNVAEYTSLLKGVEKAVELGVSDLHIRMDSELAVKQVQGQYKVKNANLKQLYEKVKTQLVKLKSYTIQHVPREQNKEADRLANLALKA